MNFVMFKVSSVCAQITFAFSYMANAHMPRMLQCSWDSRYVNARIYTMCHIKTRLFLDHKTPRNEKATFMKKTFAVERPNVNVKPKQAHILYMIAELGWSEKEKKITLT